MRTVTTGKKKDEVTGTVLYPDPDTERPDKYRHAMVEWEASVPCMWMRYTSITKLEAGS